VTAERKHPLAKCEQCPLNKTGRYVPSDGPQGAELAVVGEAPGRDEARKGKPFVGVSGRLLDTVLAHAGIEREQALLTNVVACRPPGNADPSAEAIECCHERLKSEIGEAETILALGNTAASAILGRRTKITRDRVGPAKHSDIYPNSRIIPTIHPAACLRQTDHFEHLVTDVKKVNTRVQISWEPPKYRVFGVRQASTAIQQLLESRYNPIVLDLETGVNKETAFSHPTRLRCAGIAYAPGKVAVINEEACQDNQVRNSLDKLLNSKDVICQNGKFDLQVLHVMDIANTTLYYDTMLASYAMDERKGVHSLDYMGQEILGTPNWKGVIKKHGGYNDCPGDVLYKYNAMDCAVTYDIYKWQQEQLDHRAEKLHNFLTWASDQLMYVEAEGIKIDRQALDDVTEQYSNELEDIRQQIEDIVTSTIPSDPPDDLIRLMENGGGFNPNSPDQVKLYLHSIGIGVANTDKDTLNVLTRRGRTRSFAQLMLDHRGLAKLYGTYAKGYQRRLGDDDRIYTTYLLHGTTTGRLSSRNPNIQNVPRGDVVRRMFVPSEGNVFIGADYGNIEGRVVCVLSQSESMRSVFNEGRDIHGEVAQQFFGPDYTKEQRVLAKTVVHGVNYGRSPGGIADGLNVPVTQAQGVYETYHGMFPEVRTWQAAIKHQVLVEQEPLITSYGRKRSFGLITRDNAEDVYKEALAQKPQSIASDICLTAGIRLREQGVPVRIFIHDGLVAEVPQDFVREFAELMERIMVEAGREYSTYVDWPVEILVGSSWAEV